MAFQIFSKWLLNREKENNLRNMASIVMAYSFIDPKYRIGGKGSVLVSFVEEV